MASKDTPKNSGKTTIKDLVTEAVENGGGVGEVELKPNQKST